jgi:D-psicose/D-tagatose/L-ribulose 3-epimerase
VRLAISNIAWDPEEDEAVAELLRRHDVDAVDVAPSKYFSTNRPPLESEVAAVRRWWGTRGFEITGMQALLFGTSGFNLFGDKSVQDDMLRHLDGICRIGAGLGGTRLVFGSPKNRDRGAASDAEADAIALPFFERLGELARKRGVTICLEPNPPRYGANFLTTSHETAAFVRRLDNPAIRMQLDTGALTISEEPPEPVVALNHDLIGHIHASEPDLLPIGDGSCDHGRVAASLREHLAHRLVVIEMLATKDESHLTAIERAVKAAIRHYRAERERGTVC